MRTRYLPLRMIGPAVTVALLLGACSHTVKSYDVRALDQAATGPQKQAIREVSKDEVSKSLTRIADSLRENGEYQTAIGVYQRARTADPQDPAISLGLAKALWALGAWEEAGRAFEDTHALDPANREARIGIANALILTGRLDDAVKQFQNLIVDMPDDPKVYSGLGIAYDLQGRHQDAQLRYGMGLELAPNDVATKNNLALSFALAHDFATAVELLRALPDNPATRQTLALVYGLSNKPIEAAKQARMDLDETSVQNNLDYYTWLRGLDGKAQAEAVLLGRTPAADRPKSLDQGEAVSENTPPAVPVPMVRQADIKPLAGSARKAVVLPEAEVKPVQAAETVPVVAQPKPKGIIRKVPEATPAADPDAIPMVTVEAIPEKGLEPPVGPVTLTASLMAAASSESDQAAVVRLPAPKPKTMYQAQLASFRSYEETEGVKEVLVRKHADLLSGVDLVIEEADLGPDKGSYHRLRTVPVADKSSAQALCRALMATGAPCYVVKVTGVTGTTPPPQG
jgi:Flp pilus assembly protein TadD